MPIYISKARAVELFKEQGNKTHADWISFTNDLWLDNRISDSQRRNWTTPKVASIW